MQSKNHWDKVYASQATEEVSWFQAHAELSLKLIHSAGVTQTASIIDVGGGASTLVDDLFDRGFHSVTVLDLSGAALAAARERLGERAASVRWIESDIANADLPRYGYDIWHDRAVFHFLASEQERQAYVRQVLHAVKPGGHVIVATFAEDGPTHCSGLPVQRYSAGELHAEFGEPFMPLGHEKESHQTPRGDEQKFVYCFCRKMI